MDCDRITIHRYSKDASANLVKVKLWQFYGDTFTTKENALTTWLSVSLECEGALKSPKNGHKE